MTHLIRKHENPEAFAAEQRLLFGLFDRLGILHETFEHPAVFTVEEGRALGLAQHIPGQGGKSLFLTDGKGLFWLVIARDDTRTDLKKLAAELQAKRLSFASPEAMQEMLGVTPGSATPFALINDSERKVQVVIDKNFETEELCVFHPLRNIFSTVIRVADLEKFIRALGYIPYVAQLS